MKIYIFVLFFLFFSCLSSSASECIGTDYLMGFNHSGSAPTVWHSSGFQYTRNNEISSTLPCVGTDTLSTWAYGVDLVRQIGSSTGDPRCVEGQSEATYITWAVTQTICETPIDYCANYLKDNDESGIDCGGSCAAVCELTCPDGWPPVSESNWFPDGKCFGALSPQNSLGQCPEGTAANSENGCIGIEDPLLMSDAFTTVEVVGMGIELQDLSYQGSTNVFTQETNPEITVDNGDGTSTVTSVSTDTTTSDTGMASTSETTRTDVVDNSTGDVISSSIVSVLVSSPDDNLDNYDFPGLFDSVDNGDYDPVIATEDMPLEFDKETFFNELISSSPLISVLADVEITINNAICETPAILVYGEPFSISLCRWEPDLIQFGVLFVIICKMMSLFVVYRGWK